MFSSFEMYKLQMTFKLRQVHIHIVTYRFFVIGSCWYIVFNKCFNLIVFQKFKLTLVFTHYIVKHGSCQPSNFVDHCIYKYFILYHDLRPTGRFQIFKKYLKFQNKQFFTRNIIVLNQNCPELQLKMNLLLKYLCWSIFFCHFMFFLEILRQIHLWKFPSRCGE